MFDILKTAARRWWRSDPYTNGAALSYYAIFSIAPMFILFIVVLGRFFGQQAVEGKLTRALFGFFGSDVSSMVQALIAYAYQPVTSIVAAVVSTILIIIGSLALFDQVQVALGKLWHQEGVEKISNTYLRTKILAVVMVMLLALLIMFSFVVSTLVGLVTARINPTFAAWSTILELSNTLISFGYILFLFIIMYKYLPPVAVSWKAALIGGMTGGAFFILGRSLLGLYITGSGEWSIYGVAGAIVLALVWFYYTAQIFYFGGAVTFAVDQKAKMRQTS